ncbi:MAG: glycosyltransferase [Cyanomargarita calcarea GSE-NOS-MK-12-04C]|jgi:glycosyltransferase involved in cell wall biosynthesis|uniref:Glycosyltransferase n=1 Tax=Cyanomargarita calcarea GSE-NOS-MK-12-04C TaxID=2839659 RepID=A0A951QI76_9CYAN|nr:glycosyltransferase [Cyanomargarita calcarea GSE-NOS-MK-12-04C]
MKFSVVITTYNRLDLLERAIKSVLNQTIACEVVVADDYSSDGTQDYLKSLGSHIVYHRNSKNLGHAATINAGVEASSGDWIKFLDDDDYLAPNCIEEMARAIQMHPNTALVSCVAAQVDYEEVEVNRTPQLGPGLAFYVPQADIHYGMLLELLPFGTPVQVACRRDIFLQTGGWDSSLDTNCDDIDSWIRIAQFGDAIFLNQCLAYRTIWPGAYNYKFSLQKRLMTNILMKEKIYALIDKQYHRNTPDIQDIRNYLKLHWSLVALKQKNINGLFSMIDISVLSWNAWRLLLTATFSRQSNQSNYNIRKFVLIES